jgi:hypothetical protein
MSYVTVAELRDALGIGALYSDVTVQSCLDAGEELILPMLMQHKLPVVAKKLLSNVATVYTNVPVTFVVGESVTTDLAAPFNGTVTITEVTDNSISWAKVNADVTLRDVIPHGSIGVAADWTSVDAVHQALLMTSADIWQARSATNGQAVGMDFQPSPFRMGHSLLTRVKGLLAPYVSISTMLG